MHEIYFDNSATTAMDADVAARMTEIMTMQYGNPSSLHHKGLEAQLIMDNARKILARCLSCDPTELYFTSCATESNNTALFGAANARKRYGNKIVAFAGEHPSVLQPLKKLQTMGFEIVLVPPTITGEINTDAMLDAIDDNTILLSCMFVNNETGAICDIARLFKMAKRKNNNIITHCDAVQAFGKLNLKLNRLEIDLCSASAHKLHGPKGIGLLYIKKGVHISPFLLGGGQERSFRSGTENVAGMAAFSMAAQKAFQNMQKSYIKISQLKDKILQELLTIEQIRINSPVSATPYILNFSILGFRSETMLHFLESKQIYVSSGSACSKGALSNTLTVMQLPNDRIDSAIRISFCDKNTLEDADYLIAAIKEGIATLAGKGKK